MNFLKASGKPEGGDDDDEGFKFDPDFNQKNDEDRRRKLDDSKDEDSDHDI